MNARGLFISFEGGEGSGKSTQARLFAEALKRAGEEVLHTREPGGTEGAEAIRALLVTGKSDRWLPLTEALLFYAARHEHWHRVIAPALTAGKTVLCDRFADSTRAYQAAGQALAPEFIERLHAFTLSNTEPDLTFILDIPPATGLARAAARRGAETRFEEAGLAFHTRIQAAYHALAHLHPARCRLIAAEGDITSVHRALVEAACQALGRRILPLPDSACV